MAYFLSSNLYANVKLFLCFVVVIKTVTRSSFDGDSDARFVVLLSEKALFEVGELF